MNSVVLIGNLTRAPELRYTPSGSAVCDLRMAVNRPYTTASGEKRDEVLFIGVVAWGKTGENAAEHLDKGSKVAVQGRLQSREWEAKDGSKRTAVEVVADRVEFLSWKKDGQQQPRGDGPQPETRQQADRPAGGTDDDVPF